MLVFFTRLFLSLGKTRLHAQGQEKWQLSNVQRDRVWTRISASAYRIRRCAESGDFLPCAARQITKNAFIQPSDGHRALYLLLSMNEVCCCVARFACEIWKTSRLPTWSTSSSGLYLCYLRIAITAYNARPHVQAHSQFQSLPGRLEHRLSNRDSRVEVLESCPRPN